MTRTPSPRHETLGYLANQLARLLATALADRIGPHGVVPGQFAQLNVLYEQDGLTQRELCDRIRIEQPTMAKTLQRMERDGLVRCVPDPEDRRRIRVFLTEHARRLEPELTGAARAVTEAATRSLTDSELETYLSLTRRLIESLETAGPQ